LGKLHFVIQLLVLGIIENPADINILNKWYNRNIDKSAKGRAFHRKENR
jgi:hypothetical protein